MKIFVTFLLSIEECFPLVNLEGSEGCSSRSAKQGKTIFQLNYRKLKYIRKFLHFSLTRTKNNDAKAFRKRLLRTIFRKRNHEKLKLYKDLNNSKSEIRNTINVIEWYSLIQTAQKTSEKKIFKFPKHMKRCN